MNELAFSRPEIRCEYCGRPWSGLVAYCPYCGRKSSFASISERTQRRLDSDEALTSDRAPPEIAAGQLRLQEAESPRDQPRGTAVAGNPGLDENPPGRRNAATATRSKAGLKLLFTSVAAGALLVFWVMAELPAPRTNERAAPQRPIATSGIDSPRAGAPPGAARPSIPRPTGTFAPTRSDKSQLCSVAHEKAGLCKPQK